MSMTPAAARRLEAEIINGLRRLAFDESDTEFRTSELKCKDGSLELRFYDRYRAIELLLEIARSAGASQDSSGLRKALERGARALAELPNPTPEDDHAV